MNCILRAYSETTALLNQSLIKLRRREGKVRYLGSSNGLKLPVWIRYLFSGSFFHLCPGTCRGLWKVPRQQCLSKSWAHISCSTSSSQPLTHILAFHPLSEPSARSNRPTGYRTHLFLATFHPPCRWPFHNSRLWILCLWISVTNLVFLDFREISILWRSARFEKEVRNRGTRRTEWGSS